MEYLIKTFLEYAKRTYLSLKKKIFVTPNNMICEITYLKLKQENN